MTHDQWLLYAAELKASNAELIAALRGLLDVLNDDMDSEACAAWDHARDVLARAEGSGPGVDLIKDGREAAR